MYLMLGDPGSGFFPSAKSLIAASINSAGVVSKFGATQGLLSFDEITQKMNENPDFIAKTIEEK